MLGFLLVQLSLISLIDPPRQEDLLVAVGHHFCRGLAVDGKVSNRNEGL